jgi:hypothetical protein
MYTGLLETKEFQIISMMKLKVQDTTAGSLSLATAQRMNLNNVGKLFNLLEKVATENNLY